MDRPLTYLAWRSTVNRVRRRLRRLREPRYLMGLAVAGLYFYWAFFRSSRGSRFGSGGVLDLIAGYQEAFVLAGAALILLAVTIAWLWPGRRRPRLHFSRADVQFLFPGPFSRRDLIRYKLLRSQVGVLVGSAVMTLVFRPGSLASGWTFFAGMALVMMTVNVHLVGVSLVRHGTRGAARLVWRQRLPQLVVLGAVVALVSALAIQWPRLAAMGDLRTMVEGVVHLGSTGIAGALLWPFRAVARLPLSASVPEFLQALPAVMTVLVLNYVWVVRSDVAFEEVAAEMAERRTTMAAAARPVARRGKATAAPFQLGLDGRPEVALLWKNLLLLGRYVSVAVVVRLGIMLLLMGALLARAADDRGIFATIAVVALFASFVAVFLGPQIVRNDLRQDLAYLDAVKLWPIRGAAIVRGEILAPTLVLSGFVGFALAVATVLSDPWTADTPEWLRGGPAMLALAAVFVGSGLILAQVVAQNAVVLLFPAWATIGAPRTRGLEVMGQRMLMMAAMLMVVAGAAVPAAMAAALVAVGCWALLGAVPVLLPALAASAVLVFESLVAVEALGALFERTDASAIDPAGR